MNTEHLFSDGHSGEGKKRELLPVFHRVVCGYSALTAAYWLIMCILAVLNALQDIEKFEGLRAPQPIWSHLRNYYFLECVVFFLMLAFELFMYITKSRRVTRTKSYVSNVVYFAVMLLIHVALWIYHHILTSAYVQPFTGREERMVFYRTFSDDAILPAALFLILYVSRIKIFKSKN